MDKFFANYIDQVVLALCFVGTLVYTLVLASKASFRRFPLFFVVFGAMTVCVALFAHIFENSYHAIEQVLAGTFVYTFRFYGRILMGVVFFSMSLYMLQQIKVWGMGDRSGRNNFIKAAIALSLLSAPTFPLTPIGIVPTIACAISLAGMPFARKRHKPALVLQEA